MLDPTHLVVSSEDDVLLRHEPGGNATEGPLGAHVRPDAKLHEETVFGCNLDEPTA